ncbi:MAG: hypothetical protein RBU37_05355, partial [Myxococcota bacterium]|nr:hypothetical protein [Myxococcota bacterium]
MSDAKPKASLPATPLLSSPCAHSAASRIGERRLRKTKIRVAVLAILLDAKAPLTHADVEQILIEHQFPVDRVSLYRSFSALFDAQLVLRVLAHDGCWR